MRITTNLDVLMKWQTGLGDAGKAPIPVTFTNGVWEPPTGFEVFKLTCTGGETITVEWSDGTNTVDDLVLPAEHIRPVFNISNI